MKRLLLTCFLIAGTVVSICAQNVITVSGHITGDAHWTSNNQYLLDGYVYVDAPAVLTIDPGTVIMGKKVAQGASGVSPATLIIMRGAKIMAEGTAADPIVFTSNQPSGLNPADNNPYRKAGDWGGIVICGKATVNAPGGEMTIEGGYGAVIGGGANPDDNDNSGVLKYIRIEFAGYPIVVNQEINSLTLGAVGRGTTIEYIQVMYANDDAIEWFGGTVNAKYLVAAYGVDDIFDTDYGFSGKIQFALGISDPFTADASGSNGFESDNDAGGTDNTPKTSPVFSNVTLIGPKDQYTDAAGTDYVTNFSRVVHIRRNSSLSLFNSAVGGWPVGFYVDGSKSAANIVAGTAVFENNVVFAADGANAAFPTNKSAVANNVSPTPFDAATWFNIANVEFDNASEVTFTDAYPVSGAVDARPMAGSPLLSGAAFTNAKLNDPFFEVVSYKGAFGSDDWTAGWTNWDPINAAYITSMNNAASQVATSKLYPNPVSDIVKVELELKSVSDIKIVLTDVMGKEMQTIHSGSTSSVAETINVAGLAKGIYTINYFINGAPAKAELLMVK